MSAVAGHTVDLPMSFANVSSVRSGLLTRGSSSGMVAGIESDDAHAVLGGNIVANSCTRRCISIWACARPMADTRPIKLPRGLHHRWQPCG